MEVQFRLSDYFRAGSHKVYVRKGERLKTAISIPDLIAETNEFSTKNRPGCEPKLTGSKPKELFLEYNVKCNLSTSSPEGHQVKIQFELGNVAEGTLAKELDVKCSCSCPAFLYWGGQWNTHMRDALEGDPRPLLAAPSQRRDLRDKFLICKHIAAVCERILPSVQHNINNINRQYRVDRSERLKEKRQPTKLEQRQEDMRKRLKLRQERERKNRDVQKKLLEGLKRRDEDLEKDHIVTRDTPSTPAERKVQPKLDVTPAQEAAPKTKATPAKAPALKTPPVPPKPVEQQTPNEPARTEEATTHKPLPKSRVKPTVQPSSRDRDAMDQLLSEEQKKHDQDEAEE